MQELKLATVPAFKWCFSNMKEIRNWIWRVQVTEFVAAVYEVTNKGKEYEEFRNMVVDTVRECLRGGCAWRYMEEVVEEFPEFGRVLAWKVEGTVNERVYRGAFYDWDD